MSNNPFNIPLDGMRTVRVETKGASVQLSMLVMGYQGHSASIPPVAASQIGAALKHCAEVAQENEFLS